MATTLEATVDEKTLRRLVLEYMKSILGDDDLVTEETVKIQVKTKQNWKATWEEGEFKAEYRREIL